MSELLPPRGAMHRDDPKGSRLEIANAYAVGRLIDGQAIADVWGCGDWNVRQNWPELADLLDDLKKTQAVSTC